MFIHIQKYKKKLDYFSHMLTHSYSDFHFFHISRSSNSGLRREKYSAFHNLSLIQQSESEKEGRFIKQKICRSSYLHKCPRGSRIKKLVLFFSKYIHNICCEGYQLNF